MLAVYLIFLTMLPCNISGEDRHTYSVVNSVNSPEINSEWQKEAWDGVKAISLDHFMGEKPVHFPKTEVKVCYDSDNIYLIFRVDDQFIKAIATETHGRVWEDSCVEFFFTPGADVARGYFNFESNCKGVFLFQYHLENGEKGFVSDEDCRRVEISHSLTRDVKEEYAEPEIWTVEYRIPISILSNYLDVDKPEPGVTWRANFYKCADKTSHPHWLTWAPVDHPTPKFHLPEFFGWLEFN